MSGRYILIDGVVKDSVTGMTFDSFWELLTVLNGQSKHLEELSSENEQLKSDNNRLVKETAEKVAEHQQRVLDLIDEQIIGLEKYDEICDDDWYIGQIDVLKNLKKELSE